MPHNPKVLFLFKISWKTGLLKSLDLINIKISRCGFHARRKRVASQSVVRPVLNLWGIIMTELDKLIGENRASVNEASDAAGQCLAQIDKTNLETFTDAEWTKFLETIIKGYIANAVPF